MLPGGPRNATSTLGQKRNSSSFDSTIWCGKEISDPGRAKLGVNAELSLAFLPSS